ncbi:MAG: hypothetical protein A3E87_05455 [Gammaproteobacteria bacterium RIFCSPHIGHO2_12_FULL_35_23]|nr:MAG: hypothetical protein A3E87_05455 [Gammaproteobacteria bacterium RIFCSPHIGHO2_12_FULL_35_23]
MSHPLRNWQNTFKELSQQDMPLLGMFIVSGSSIISECSATTDLHWVAADMEASPATKQDLIHIAQSFNGSSVSFLVRVAENNQQLIESALDIGAQGIVVPKVSTKEEALQVTSACYYPPLGTRGLNPIRCSGYFYDINNYLKNAKNITCMVQIETVEAVENLDEIATVKGISGLFIGCGDLAACYEIPGEFEHPKFQEAIKKVLNVCKKNHLIPGIFAYSNQLAKEYIKMGFKMIGIGNEIKFLKTSIEGSIREIKS